MLVGRRAQSESYIALREGVLWPLFITAAVMAAFQLRLEAGTVVDVRLAYGGMAATPKRAAAAEAAMLGRPWSEATVEASQTCERDRSITTCGGSPA